MYSRSEGHGTTFQERWGIPESTTDLATAVNHPDTDVVVVALPNFLREEAIQLVAKAGKAVLCTKPLGRTAVEARQMLAMVEDAGIFAGYLDVTLGMVGILAAREIWLLATGSTKAELLSRTLEGPVTGDVPTSLLRGHPGLRIIVDDEAAAERRIGR